MGNKSSATGEAKQDEVETSNTARAIARGRIYVVIRYPNVVEKLEGTLFNEHQFREVLSRLQQVSIVLYCISSNVPFITSVSLGTWRFLRNATS